MIEEGIVRPTTRAACVREIQKSLDQSVKQLLEDKIKALGVESRFEPLDSEIHILDENGQRRGLIIFQGMQNHTAASIKSLEGYGICWAEEAQSLSKRSLDLLTPTFRVPGAELWFSWNPDKDDDPVDAFFRGPGAEDDPDVVSVPVNYWDNPWFWDTSLVGDMERDRRRDPDKYAHVWLGEYARRSESRVFRNWRIEDFATPPKARFFYGADWGFSVDPTVLVRCWILERTLFVDQEAYAVGCPIERTPALFEQVDSSRRWPITADSARPETIDYMRGKGFDINPALKGAGSVEDGIEFLKNYDIVVHPRCVRTADELAKYSYKIDKRTNEVLPVLEDKDNHVIDSLRYALEGLRRSATLLITPEMLAASRQPGSHMRRR